MPYDEFAGTPKKEGAWQSVPAAIRGFVWFAVIMFGLWFVYSFVVGYQAAEQAQHEELCSHLTYGCPK